jgi:Cft2 family RNA processing exonuclease
MKVPESKAYQLYTILNAKEESTLEENVIKEIHMLEPVEKCQLFFLLSESHIRNHEIFTEENKVWEGIRNLFIGNYEETRILLLKPEFSLNLVEEGIKIEVLDFEDFRTVVRYLYTNATNTKKTIDLINKMILNLLLFLNGTLENPIEKFLALVRFLGIPPSGFDQIVKKLNSHFPSHSEEISILQQLPIATCQRYPEYTREIAEKMEYDTNISVMKQWLDHTTLNKLTDEKLKHFFKSWKLQESVTNKDFFKKLNKKRKQTKVTTIPLRYESFVKPYSTKIKPQTVRTTELPSTIPSELLPRYLERVAYPVVNGKDTPIQVTFLGGAQIGTMGILISTSQSTVLLDYGLSVANYQFPAWHEALPYLDAIFLTHAHLDHSGAIPYLFSQGYSGYVVGSSMTRELTKILLVDSQKLIKNNFSETVLGQDFRFKSLVQDSYLYQMLDNYLSVSSGKEYQITPDIAVKPFNAHHIQGSLAYQIETHDKKILFTGDINLDPSTLFQGKKPVLPLDSDLAIVDSTYYGQPSTNLKERDEILYNTVKESKRVIIPAFAIGRAQEILSKLDQKGITSDRKVSMLGLASKVARISGIRTQGHLSNQLIQPFDDEIVIAGGGMLNGGYARALVEETKDDPETTIILCGYLAKNTLGYRLLHNLEPNYKQKVVFTRFSGHSTNETLNQFLSTLQGTKVLVHLGELSKDPYKVDKEDKRRFYSKEGIKIPSIGSTVLI